MPLLGYTGRSQRRSESTAAGEPGGRLAAVPAALLDLAGAGAAITAARVAIVALLTALDSAVAAGSRDGPATAVAGAGVGWLALLVAGRAHHTVAAVGPRAVVAAGVRIDAIAVVALLAGLDAAVAADRRLGLAGAGAAVAVLGIAVVALLARLDDTVAADRRFVLAGAGAAVAVPGVAIVALLDAGPDVAIAADRVPAVVEAGVAVRRVAVVALLVLAVAVRRLADAIAAPGLPPAGAAAACAVGRVALLAAAGFGYAVAAGPLATGVTVRRIGRIARFACLDNAVAADDWNCLLYTSDAADDLLCVDLGGRRIIKKKKG